MWIVTSHWVTWGITFEIIFKDLWLADWSANIDMVKHEWENMSVLDVHTQNLVCLTKSTVCVGMVGQMT